MIPVATTAAIESIWLRCCQTSRHSFRLIAVTTVTS